MSSLKKLAGETAIYGISSIVGRFISYLLVPLYTQFFSPAEYGIVTELYAYVAFFIIIYTYGMETAFFRFASNNAEGEKKIFNNAFTLILTTSLVFSSLLAAFATPLVEWMEYPGKEYYIYMFAAILALDAIMAIPFARLRLQNKALQFASAKLINIGINVGLNVFFIVFCQKVAEGAIFPSLWPYVATFYDPAQAVSYIFVSNLIASAALIFILWKPLAEVRLSLDFKALKPMLIYAYPLMFMGLAGVTNEMLSRPMLKYYLPEGFYTGLTNQEVLGIFGACYKLSIFMTLGIQAFRFASEPFFFASSKDKNSPELFAKVMHWFVIAGCFTLFAISINLDIISLVFLQSEAYWKALNIVPILLLANLFLGIYYNLSIWFKLSDKTYFGSWISIFGAVITIVLNIALIPIMGYEGSALVTLICYFTMSAICFYLGQKHYPIPYNLWRNLGYILGTVLLTYLVMSIHIEDMALSISFHFMAILAFLGLVFLLEKNHIKFKSS